MVDHPFNKPDLWPDPIIDAYLIIVDGEPFGIVQMPKHRGYGFSYAPTFPSWYERFLPETYKSFSVIDLPRKLRLCGRVSP